MVFSALMRPQMSFVVCAASESLSADVAVITKLASVKLHMLFQAAFHSKLFIALFTLELLLFNSSSFPRSSDRSVYGVLRRNRSGSNIHVPQNNSERLCKHQMNSVVTGINTCK